MNKTNKMIHVQFSTPLQSRKEMMNGESYVVYPVIMMTEGVHAGSGGPTLYTADELFTYHWTWNGVPVSIDHPKDDDDTPISCNDPQVYNKQVIGTIFNTVFEDNKLKAEVWLKESVLNSLGADVIRSLESGTNLEVSTGLFSDIQDVSGKWEGETYNAVATNIRPDHLALLPGGIGACSWEDGCGIRANKGEEMKKDSLKYFTEENSFNLKILEQEMEYTQLVEAASVLVDSLDNDQYHYYVRKLYSDFIVYAVYPRTGNVGRIYYKRNYTIDNGKLSFDGDPVEVVIKETIETVTNKKQEEQNKEEGMGKTMEECCPATVDELIKNNDNFMEEDREVLLAMTEESFAMVINKAKPIEKKEEKEEKEEEIEVNEKEEETNEEEKKMTFDELLANADPEVAESIRNGHRIFQERKQDLVKKIIAHEANSFSEDDLKTFSFDYLEKIASFIPEKKGTNYIGNAGSYQNNPDENPDEGVLPDMDFDFSSKE